MNIIIQPQKNSLLDNEGKRGGKSASISFLSDSTGLFIEGKTPRLYIRSYDPTDYSDCLLLYSDKDITKFFDHGQPRTEEEINNYILERGRKYFDISEPYGLFSVFSRIDSSFIGQVDLVPTGSPGEVEIGWIFHQKYQNQGYCSEAVLEFLLPLIYELIGIGYKSEGTTINRIIATAHPLNIASNKIIQKAGLKFEKFQERYGGNPRLWYGLSLPLKAIQE